MRLHIISTAVEQICGGHYVPHSHQKTPINEALVSVLSHQDGLDILRGLLAICQAITQLANTRKISVADARSYHHAFVGPFIDRQFYQWTSGSFTELVYGDDFKSLFDLGGITVEDETDEHHFVSLDTKMFNALLKQTIHEMKLAKMQDQFANLKERRRYGYPRVRPRALHYPKHQEI